MYHRAGWLSDRTYWLSNRKTLSERFLAEPRYLKDLYYKVPVWLDFPVTLAARQTLEVRQTARFRTWILALTGNSTNGLAANEFSVQIYDLKSRRKFSRTAVDALSGLGSAQQKYWLRRPLRFEANATIVVQFKNLTAAGITARVCLEGVNDAPDPALTTER